MRRPEHIFINDDEHLLICSGCLVDESIPQRIRNNPEAAREFRKEAQRLALVGGTCFRR
jgi:hypothetical protein